MSRKIATDARYRPYVERQTKEIEQLRRHERQKLPIDLSFAAIPGLSTEMVERLTASRPTSLAAASRLRGITPAALSAILLYTRRQTALRLTEEEARDAVRIIVGNRAISRLELLASSIIAENSRQNLIATSTIDTMWSRHLLDSIQLVQWAAADDGIWVDIGTGGGFPGLAIAVATGRTITLVEPRRQRASFLKEMVTEFGLSNVSVVQTRVERLDVCEATILSARAVASIATLFEAAIQCSTSATRWLLPRGTGWQTDIERAKVAWKGVFHVEQSLSDPSSRVVVATGVARR